MKRKVSCLSLLCVLFSTISCMREVHFRYSYETIWRGPAISGKRNKNDISDLFLSPKYADVGYVYLLTKSVFPYWGM